MQLYFAVLMLGRLFQLIMRRLFICLVICWTACQMPGKPYQKQASSTLSASIDARWKEIDSAVIVFYDEPYGQDSLRYARYYTQLSATEAPFLQVLAVQLDTTYTIRQTRDRCRGEGKIWCYRAGQVKQTLYFNVGGPSDCTFVYWIKDGQFYYTKPKDVFAEWLHSHQSLAKKPTS